MRALAYRAYALEEYEIAADVFNGGQPDEAIKHLEKAERHFVNAQRVIGVGAALVAEVTARQYSVQAQIAFSRGTAALGTQVRGDNRGKELAAKCFEHSSRRNAAIVAVDGAPSEIVERAQRDMHMALGFAANTRGDIAKSEGQFEVAVDRHEEARRAWLNRLEVTSGPISARTEFEVRQVFARAKAAECRTLLAAKNDDREGAAVHAQEWVAAQQEGAQKAEATAFATYAQNQLRRAREEAAPYLSSTRDNDAANANGAQSSRPSPGGENPAMLAAEPAPRAETVLASHAMEGNNKRGADDGDGEPSRKQPRLSPSSRFPYSQPGKGQGIGK
ncbi:hypothetical protein [Ralstonia psammae]|uniref:hypothetical protein n=1 Tax=Ralstonia psammae TaxID=3058598 RepID=UPI00292D3F6A|nr:hypothetical protein [Ralstonia sp. LMG 19083]